MWYLVGFVFVLALGTSGVAGCGESSIPCDRWGAGCALSDGSVGMCRDHACRTESGPISCKHGYNDQADWPDGTLCRSSDLREGTCLDGVCGGEHFCERVVCDEPDNLCGSDQFCNWEGVCEFRQVTQCFEGNTCTTAECDPDIGCVYINRPDGARCALPGSDFFCCVFGLSCCDTGTCMDGVCVPD